MVGAVWTQLTKTDVVVNEEKEEIFEATIFFQAHTFLSNLSPIIALGKKSAESEKPRQHVSNADRKVFAASSLLAEEFLNM